MSERYTDGFENVGTNAKRPRRILIDDELDALDVTDALLAPLAGPTFTGTVVLPSTTSIGNVSATEIAYVDGVTSAIQTQFTAKADLASPTFTGTVALPVVTVTKGTPGTESTNAVTVNGSAGVITTSALTTAAAGSYLITLSNSSIVGTGSVILVSAAGGTNTTKDFSMEAICTAAGTATITIYNNVLVTTALNGTIIIHFMVV